MDFRDACENGYFPSSHSLEPAGFPKRPAAGFEFQGFRQDQRYQRMGFLSEFVPVSFQPTRWHGISFFYRYFT